ncbi:hypothetical protein JCM8115_003931 [Rhodotorula mucilaginosa]
MSLVARLVPSSLVDRLEPLLARLPSGLPRPLKWAFIALLIFNIDGLPGVWHARIMWPFIAFQWQVRLGKKWPNWRIGKDEFDFTTKREFRASFNSSDTFGYHLSNSSFAVCLDHVRGPFAVQLVGEAYGIDGMTFALGGTAFDYLKEIPVMSKFEVENRLLGYDRKWLYVSTTFQSRPHPRTGERKIYCKTLSRVVIKHNRRTVSPHRAFALTGYGAEHGERNWAIAQTMSKQEQLQWLFGEKVEGGAIQKGDGIVLGPVERGMDTKSTWPGQLA